MCGSQLCVEVGIPWCTEISLMCRFHLYQLQMVRATYVVYRWFLVTFVEGEGQLCTYTLSQIQLYSSSAELTHVWISVTREAGIPPHTEISKPATKVKLFTS